MPNSRQIVVVVQFETPESRTGTPGRLLSGKSARLTAKCAITQIVVNHAISQRVSEPCVSLISPSEASE